MKTVPPWLREFYRQWHINRGRKLQPGKQAFFRPWEDLLDTSGLKTAAERNYAMQEAEALEREGRLVLKRPPYRSQIDTIALPVAAESWLLNLCGGISAHELQEQANESVRLAMQAAHPRWPESWQHLCEKLLAAFAESKNLPPFFWHDPGEISVILGALRGLTAREWPPQTLIRDASTALGFDSKFLEKKSALLQRSLSLLFEEETSLESLGLSLTQSRATLHGPLSLHYPDGSIQTFAHLHGEYSISGTDLVLASHATTTAARILSLENAKTSFRQAVALNAPGDTLLLASSYPSAATRRLLEILPAGLPHYHFGDTDTSGYSILRSLRDLGHRPVQALHMDWQDEETSPPLSEHDLRLLPKLLQSPTMADCSLHLIAMQKAGRKGNFEQERRGAPSLSGWPFWSLAVQEP